MASSGKHNSNIAHLTPEIISNWPTPNYDNPERITWLPIYSGIWFGAATILLVLRYWLRIRGHAGRLGLDDVSQTKARVAHHKQCRDLTISTRQFFSPAGLLA
jgi:hypothetical protein